MKTQRREKGKGQKQIARVMRNGRGPVSSVVGPTLRDGRNWTVRELLEDLIEKIVKLNQ